MTDLNDIAIFTKVVEHNSFSAAARVLGMPNSAVSRKVARLEQQLGVKLLQRTTRKLHLTEAGELFYERCSYIIAEAEDAERQISNLQEQPKGHLKITAPIEIGTYFLSDFVCQFMEKYPEMTVEIELTSRVVDLIEEGFDLAIRAGQPSDSSLVGKKLGVATQVIVASPEYLKRHKKIRTPEDLKQLVCILPRWSKRVIWQFKKRKNVSQVNVNGQLRTNNLTFMRKAAENSQGIALLPKFVCAEAIENQQLVTLFDDYEVNNIDMYAIFPSRKYLSQKTRLFLDELTMFVSQFDW